MKPTLGRTRILLALTAATALTGVGVGVGSAHAATPSATCDGLRATMVGTAGDDRITGTPGNDVIVGHGGDDTISGGGGDDVVCGGDGADVLSGGPGNDRLYGGRDKAYTGRGGSYLDGDTLRGGQGDDLLDVGVDTREAADGSGRNFGSWSSATQGVTVDLSGAAGTATGAGTDTVVLRPQLVVIGSPYADTLTGSAGPDVLFGGAGDDTLNGLAGDDELSPDAVGVEQTSVGDDAVLGGPGNDRIIADGGRDVLHGDAGDDQVATYSDQPSKLYGDDGDDEVDGVLTRASGYVVDGGAGDDRISLGRPDGDQGGTHVPTEIPLGTLDLGAGTITVGWQPTPSTGTVVSAEHVGLDDYLKWDVTGSEADDDVRTGAYYRLRASMLGGDDNVTGSLVGDRVDGGPGDDTVDGFGGTDVCTNTEHRIRCSAS